MSYVLYHQSIESATLTYSATADTNYPATNCQDRHKNTFFKDTGIGETVYIVVDFGSARACSHIILGNYQANATNDAELNVKYGTADNGSDFENTSLTKNIETSSLDTVIGTFTSQSKRHWKIQFNNKTGESPDELDYLQIGTIFLGTAVTLSHSPELDITQSANTLSVSIMA